MEHLRKVGEQLSEQMFSKHHTHNYHSLWDTILHTFQETRCTRYSTTDNHL